MKWSDKYEFIELFKKQKISIIGRETASLKSDEQKNIEIVIENNTNLFENEL